MQTCAAGRISSRAARNIYVSFTAPRHHINCPGHYVIKQHKQFAYNVTLWRVRVTTAATKMQQCFLCVLLGYTSLSTMQHRVLYKNAFVADLRRRQQ
jgi:hypothetical protein